MRTAFSEALVRLAQQDPRVLLLTGDHGYALFDEFRKQSPKQYFNMGIAEQNMVGMAAGLAKAGFIPFVYGLSSFIPVRVLEQIKLDIAHDKHHVVLLGDGAGFVYSYLGTSHQSNEDIAITRVIPDLIVLSPADRFEQTLCMEWAYQARTSVYLRMGKSDRGDVHNTVPNALMGDILQVKPGKQNDLSFVATGSMVQTAMQLAIHHYPDATVWSVPTLKPINLAQVVNLCKNSSVVVTLEEHSVMGGLGSLVSEISAEHAPVRILRVGVNDCFSERCGSYEYLLREHKLDLPSVHERVRTFMLSV
ncbi:MAG: transketolase [Magnetococcales bacterium]|nr:transketolase [Magnetococcales bacterium]